MFTLDDFWKILEYLSGQSVPDLDSTIKTLADSERGKTTSLFENTIDQTCFSTEDYKRIRKFLIDWYTSLKTNVTLGRNSHDPFILPADYLNELIKSFGYPYPADIVSVNIRANFFLDLVNLYKIKGTPLALRRALDYISLRNVDLAEYWLQKNDQGKLIFRGVSLYPIVFDFPFQDVRFETASGDPHWFQTEQDILQLFDRNILNLPSKTPYIGLRPYFSYTEVQKTISILVRMLADQYDTWSTTGALTQDIKSALLRISISMLECYLACVYIVATSIPYQDPALYSSDSYMCYDGTSTEPLVISAEYEALMTYTPYPDEPEIEIAEKKAKADQFLDLFYRENPRNFIKTKSGVDSAGDLLNNISPSLKSLVDTYMSAGKWFELLISLMGDLSAWVRVNINLEATEIIAIFLGVEGIPSVNRVVNFFKPYRARILTSQFLYVIDQPIFDYIRIYDKIKEFKIIETVYDYITADSLSCCSGDLMTCFDGTSLIEPILYSREFYDCGSYHDIGAVWDRPVEIIEWITVRSVLNCHTDTTSSECWFWEDSTSACDFWGNWYDVPFTDATSDVEIVIRGNFRDFDTCGIFDCPAISDIVKVRLMPPIDVDFYGNPLAGYTPFDVQFHDLSIGLVRHWLWNFGDISQVYPDGEISIEQNPLHTFVTPRSGGPIAAWSSANLGSCIVSFTNDSDGWPPKTFLWDFGDGTTSTDENPVHTFPKDTAYLIKLTTFNAYGNSTAENSILVES